MPMYEYKCEVCEHVFEEYLSMSQRDNPLEKPCPNCLTKESVKKLVSVSTMGVDMKMGVPGWFQDKLAGIKDITPKRFHDSLDKAGNRNGGKLGPQ